MSRARDQRRQARMALHQDRSVPALYIAVQGATPVPCTVRVHTKFEALGQLDGGNQYASRAEIEPRIIFLVADVPAPRVNGVVSVEAGEAYTIAAVDPADDTTITAKVARMSAAQATGLPVPA